MKIIVCLKQVPNTTQVKLDPVKGTLIRDGVESIINPDDKAGLELALTLKDKHGAEVTVLSMGPKQAEKALKEALAMGADKAILLTDRVFAGADTWATSSALAGALRKLDYDVIIAGRQAIDGDTAQVGPQVAEHLSLPHVSYVMEYEHKGDHAIVKRAFEDGYQMIKLNYPCLITTLTEMNKPRYMSVAGIIEVNREDKIELWDFSKIDADKEQMGLKGSPTKVKKSFTKQTKAAGVQLEGTPEQLADAIVEKLKENFII